MSENQYNGPERRTPYQTALESRLSMLHEDVADIKSALKDLTSAITLADPRTEGGLQALVDGGLLTAERKTEIVGAML